MLHFKNSKVTFLQGEKLILSSQVASKGLGPASFQACCVPGLSPCQLTPLWAALPCQADHGMV